MRLEQSGLGRREPDGPPATPPWMVMYADCMGLLLCVFVLLFSMSEIKQDDRFRAVIESIQSAFGGTGEWQDEDASAPPTEHDLLVRLQELEATDHARAKPELGTPAGSESDKLLVATSKDGIRLVFAGPVTFEPFSAALKPEARALIAKAAEPLHGFHTKILVRGHAASGPWPRDLGYEDARDLSYARAKSVAVELERNGIRRARLTPVAVGDNEPLVPSVETEAAGMANGRIEILVTDEWIEEAAGSDASGRREESSHGGGIDR